MPVDNAEPAMPDSVVGAASAIGCRCARYRVYFVDPKDQNNDISVRAHEQIDFRG